MKPYSPTADLLCRTRTQLGLTQKKLARALGISASSYSRYERGERLPPDDIITKVKKLLE